MDAPLAAGQLFAGDFEIVRELAQGGMGVVYVARQRSTGALRALKVMQPSLVSASEPEQAQRNQERFLMEARVSASIASSHVAQVVVSGFDPNTGAPWYAMELLNGQDLKATHRERGRFSAPEVAEIFLQLTHALGAAHRAGVFHIDLKPEQIFLARSDDARVSAPKAKVLDFGIAKLVSEQRRSATVTTAMGSPFWMSPEQAQRGQHVVAASDVWALGLIAFWMLTGKHYWLEANVPKHEVNITAWLLEMMTSPLVSASQRAREVGHLEALPPSFDGWFARCVNRDPAARFQDADSMMSALRAVLEVTPSSPPMAAPVPATQVWDGAPVSPVGGTAPMPMGATLPVAPAPTPAPTPAPVAAPARERARVAAFSPWWGRASIALACLTMIDAAVWMASRRPPTVDARLLIMSFPPSAMREAFVSDGMGATAFDLWWCPSPVSLAVVALATIVARYSLVVARAGAPDRVVARGATVIIAGWALVGGLMRALAPFVASARSLDMLSMPLRIVSPAALGAAAAVILLARMTSARGAGTNR